LPALVLTRRADWVAGLNAATERHRSEPARWGESDCLLAAMDVVSAVTGVDPVADIRGKYSTEAGAAKILLARGYRDVEAALNDHFPHIGRLSARRGDLATMLIDEQPRAGWITEYGAAFKVPSGLAFFPQTQINRAFRVG
jgi:hypothetical protein